MLPGLQLLSLDAPTAANSSGGVTKQEPRNSLVKKVAETVKRLAKEEQQESTKIPQYAAIKKMFKEELNELRVWREWAVLPGTHFDVEPAMHAKLHDFADANPKRRTQQEKAVFYNGIFALMPELTELEKTMVRAGAIRFNNYRADGAPTFVIDLEFLHEKLAAGATFDLAIQTYLWFISYLPGKTLVQPVKNYVDIILTNIKKPPQKPVFFARYTKLYEDVEDYCKTLMEGTGVDISLLTPPVTFDDRLMQGSDGYDPTFQSFSIYKYGYDRPLLKVEQD